MRIVFGLLLWIASLSASAQCVVINEVMINGPGPCDGNCVPNTEEWVELYNTCSTSVDVSCYVLTDGDFAVTFPPGTIIPAGGYLTIGSINSAITIDIDLATCGCTSGTGIGIYSNANEQIILLSNTGLLLDAVYWGAGQFPVNISSSNVGTCGPVNVNYPIPASGFTQLSGSGSNGCTMARICDGSPIWVERCGNEISGHSSNGQSNLNASFSASQTSICAGDCISFTDNSTGGPTSWQWIFQGASSGTSSLNAPTNICYLSPGTYDVTLIISNSCGSDTAVSQGYIQVQSSSGSAILISGNTTFCQGSNTTLSVPSAFSTYQWYLNNQPITGANASFYTTQTPGSYYVTVGSGNCIATSNTVIVTVQSIVEAVINSTADTLCPGDVAQLSSVNTASTYQWLFNGSVISGQSGSSLSITNPGSYQLITTTSQGCSDTSDLYTIISPAAAAPAIQSNTGVFEFCSGGSIILSVPDNYSAYQWLFNGNVITGQNTASLVVQQSGIYSLQLNINGCAVSTQPVTVSVFPLPQVQIISLNNYFCAGSFVTLQSDYTAQSYSWINNGITVGNSATYNVSTAGNYQLSVTDVNGCTALSAPLYISEYHIEPVVISVDTTVALCAGNAVTLTTVSSYLFYQWYLNAQPLNTNSSVLVSESGNYSVMVHNGNECVSSDNIQLNFAECGAIYFPTAFSPNGDGKNDIFKALGNDVASLELWIYNRYGQLVFYSNNKNDGWNGDFNGLPAPVGVYVFHFLAKDYLGNRLYYKGTDKGNLTLLR